MAWQVPALLGTLGGNSTQKDPGCTFSSPAQDGLWLVHGWKQGGSEVHPWWAFGDG